MWKRSELGFSFIEHLQNSYCVTARGLSAGDIKKKSGSFRKHTFLHFNVKINELGLSAAK